MTLPEMHTERARLRSKAGEAWTLHDKFSAAGDAVGATAWADEALYLQEQLSAVEVAIIRATPLESELCLKSVM